MGGKALILVPPAELEIFYQDLAAKALLLVPSTELEMFYQDLAAKALLLVPSTELDRNILDIEPLAPPERLWTEVLTQNSTSQNFQVEGVSSKPFGNRMVELIFYF